MGNADSGSFAIAAAVPVVAFTTDATNFSPRGSHYGRIVIRDARAGTARRLRLPLAPGGKPFKVQLIRGLSQNGRIILVMLGEEYVDDGWLYLIDRTTDRARLIASKSNEYCRIPIGNAAYLPKGADLSADGRRVSFTAYGYGAAAAERDKEGCSFSAQGFVFDASSGNRTLVTTGASSTLRGKGISSMSPNGLIVAFIASEDCDQNAEVEHDHLYLHNVGTGTTTELTTLDLQCNTGGAVVPRTLDTSFSFDGSLIAFDSVRRLDPRDTNDDQSVYVWSPGAGFEVASGGTVDGIADRSAIDATISADGRYVAFKSNPPIDMPCGPDPSGSCGRILIRDLESGRLVAGSVSSSDGHANGESSDPSLSADGRFLVFDSIASNILQGRPSCTSTRDWPYNGRHPCAQVYLRDLVSLRNYLISAI